MLLREAFERQRDRFLGEDEIALRFRRATELLRGGETEVAEGIVLTEQTLAFDPYDVAMHRELAVVRARAGDPDALAEHLAVCFDMGALDASSLRADPALRGRVAAGAFEQLVTDIETGHGRRSRFKDVSFDEIAPRTNTFETTLVWAPEHQPAIDVAFRRLIEAAARSGVSDRTEEDLTTEIAWLETYAERLKSPFTLDDHLIGTHAYFGDVHRFLREIAPYVEDVRFLMFDQVSPHDEFWIVGGSFHVFRHPLEDSDSEGRARYFEELCARDGLDDPTLRPYLAKLWSTVAHVDLEANENRRSYADGTAERAAYAIERLLVVGDRPPSFFQARLHAFRGDRAEAIRHLEATIATHPDFREPFVMLARHRLDDRRFEEAIALADRAILLRPDYQDEIHLVRAVALESLGRREEAAAAYLQDTELRQNSSGRLLRDADGLVARGLHTSAALVYERLLDEPFSTGLAAELGLGTCADAVGRTEDARRHYERVIARAPGRRAEYAASRGLLDAIDRIETAARAALAR